MDRKTKRECIKRNQDAVLQAYADCSMRYLNYENVARAALRNLKFKAPFALPAREFQLQIGLALSQDRAYNEFDAIATPLELTEKLRGTKARYRIAREGSVCIYVEGLTKAQATSLVDTTYGRFNPSSLLDGLKVDEASIEPDGSVRLWWD